MPYFEGHDWGLRIDLVNRVLDGRTYLAEVESVLRTCRERGTTRLLVDARGVRRNVSAFGLLEGVESASRLRRALRIAFVAPELVDSDDSKLACDAGYTRGVFIRYFAAEPEALEWLLADGVDAAVATGT